jgi:hypothetical protein
VREPASGGASLATLSALRSAAAALGAISPRRRGRLAWRELANKLLAFETFRRAGRRARAGAGGPPLAALAARELALGRPGRTVWALEGLGYGHAERRTGRDAWTPGWVEVDGAGLPAASLIALHSGIGLSLARRRLAALADAPAAELRSGVAGYPAACREVALPGHAAPLLEALGFIARLRLARRAGEVAAALAPLDEEAHACFWHGWGRALYFVPGHAAPRAGARARMIAALAREAPRGEARDNALAGLAWAATLVNLRHPQVLEELLRRPAAEPGFAELASEPGFAHGVGSAVLVWRDCAPHDPYLDRWRGHRPRPEPGDGELAQLWERQVSGPAETALARDRERPRRDGEVDELFRLRSAPAEAPGTAASQGAAAAATA